MTIAHWPESLKARERAAKSLSGGVSTGMRASMKPHPLFFERGEGSRLVDLDGNSYIDHVLGWGPVIVGHGHPHLTAAVAAQVPLGATYGSGHRLEYEAAELVVDRIPGVERVLWSNTGTEATQVALRLARAHTGRNRFIKFVGHYHGWSDTMLLGYRPDADGRMDSLATRGQSERSRDEVALVEWGDLAAVRAVLSEPGADIAAIFTEPVLCNSGVIAPPLGFLEGLRALANEFGAVLVFDEVITGFRLGRGGATERFGVSADLVVLAKAIAGGYPLSAVAGRAHIIDQTQRGVVHAGTYNGNPIVLAAAKATLEILDGPGIYEQFERQGERLAAGLRAAASSAGVAATINQVGAVVQVLPGVASGAAFGDFIASDQAFYDEVVVGMLRRGVFALPGGRWYLSTAHTDEDIEKSMRAFEEALVEAASSHSGASR